LTLPYLIERLGREDRIERRTAQSALARLCFRFPRLKPTILPFLRTGLSDPDDSFRRAAQFLLSQLADVTTLPALVDAMEYQGGREGADSSKAVYAMSARTLGYGAAEPLPDQVAAFQRLRGWWNQTQDKFQPIALSDVDSTAHSLRIWEDLNPQQRQQKLESFLFGLDSRASGEAFCVLHNERAPTDVLWAQVEAKTTIRERSFALLAQFGNGAKIKTFADTLHCTIGVPPEHPLLRALSIVGLASLQNQKNSGSNVLLESLRRGVFNLIQDNVKTTTSNHPTLSAGVYWQRLAILCLALQDRDPASLAYLKTQIEKGLKVKASDPLNWITVKSSDEMELFRASFLVVCARTDSTELLLTLLKESEIPAIRETCARELSLRRVHAAVSVIVKILEKAETVEWQDLCRALLPLLKPEDALLVANLLNGVETTSRVAGAFLLNLRPDIGVDEKTLAQLCSGLTDKSNTVRYYCAEALGKRKAMSAVRKLCVALSDEDENVRAAVAEALGLIGDETACQLATTASEKEVQITPRWLRVLALGGGVIQQQSILKFCNSTALSDQRAGLEALSVSKQASASERLVKTFHNDESVMQSIALDALGAQGDKMLDVLNVDLTAPDVATRMRLALLLSRWTLKTPKVQAVLNTLLTDKDENVQALAKFILERPTKK
jgi:HEAT repeat protein